MDRSYVGPARIETDCCFAGEIDTSLWVSICTTSTLNLEECAFWSRAPLTKGNRYEIALGKDPLLDSLFTERLSTSQTIKYEDGSESESRMAVFENNAIETLLFSNKDHRQLPDRNWISDKFLSFENVERQNAWMILAGSDSDAPAKGRLVCSCFEVGELQILDAIANGANSCEALGEKLRCGTNCGSCLPELKSFIALSVAEEAA